MIQKSVSSVIKAILNYALQHSCEGQALALSFLPRPLQQLFLLLNIHFGFLCRLSYAYIFPGKNTLQCAWRWIHYSVSEKMCSGPRGALIIASFQGSLKDSHEGYNQQDINKFTEDLKKERNLEQFFKNSFREQETLL